VQRFAIIGGGNLGSAFARGFLRAGLTSFVVVEPDTAKHCKEFESLADVGQLSSDVSLAIITVKPPLVASVLRQLPSSVTTVVSFAAGVTLEAMKKTATGTVVRAMGSTAAAFGASLTTLVTQVGERVPESLVSLFAALGEVVTLADEKHIDAAMALSASAPAFMLAAAEGLSDGGVRLGLSRDLADRFALSALRAAAAVGGSEPMTQAKHRITSPGGTTIEGLAVLEKAAVRSAFAEAAVACAKRGKELLG
jgi:pyrroline-5-carboxylate reductase